jgi:plasmid stabilization system protein ParE
MPRVRIDDAAAQELAEAADWYEAESPGTGERLLEAFEAAVSLLREEPLPLASATGQAGLLGAKRLLLHRFPFDVIIVEEGGELVVIAVAHQSRRPGYWVDRTGA